VSERESEAGIRCSAWRNVAAATLLLLLLVYARTFLWMTASLFGSGTLGPVDPSSPDCRDMRRREDLILNE
jgi:hypothetical protein